MLFVLNTAKSNIKLPDHGVEQNRDAMAVDFIFVQSTGYDFEIGPCGLGY